MPKVEDFIAHFADANYDPVKAHEYYLRTRELEGKKPKRTYRYSSDQRKEGSAYLAAQSKKNSEELNKKIEDLKLKAEQTRQRIVQKLLASMGTGSDLELRSVGVQLKGEIDKVRKEYKAARDKLAAQREQLNS